MLRKNTELPSAPKIKACMSFRLVDFNVSDKKVDPTYMPDSENEDTEDVSGTSGSSAPSSPDKDPRSLLKTIKRTTEQSRTFQIQMFGINERGKTCSIIVPDFKPFFYAKINKSLVLLQQVHIQEEWDETTKTDFIDFIKSLLPELDNASGLVDSECELVYHKKLYMFDAGKDHQFIKLVFHTVSAMKRARNLWFTKVAIAAPSSGSESGTAPAPKKQFDRMRI
jgi:hypothetical protein